MFKMLKNLTWKEWLMATVSVVFIVAQVWLDLKLPEYMSQITSLLTTGSDNMSEIWKNGGFMIACAVGSALMSVVVGFFCCKNCCKAWTYNQGKSLFKNSKIFKKRNEAFFNSKFDNQNNKRCYTSSKLYCNGASNAC